MNAVKTGVNVVGLISGLIMGARQSLVQSIADGNEETVFALDIAILTFLVAWVVIVILCAAKRVSDVAWQLVSLITFGVIAFVLYQVCLDHVARVQETHPDLWARMFSYVASLTNKESNVL